MGRLVDGEWHSGQSFANASGQFVRQTSSFRERITADGGSEFPAEAGRYHLYVARACPWYRRALIYRALKKLEGIVSVSYVEPLMLDEGWVFPQPDPLTGVRRVYELYRRADPRYTGCTTVPVLWDKATGRIVNNESSDIIRMFNSAFDALTGTRELHQMPGIAETIAIDECKTHHYGCHRHINPTGIVPIGPMLDFTTPHGREE